MEVRLVSITPDIEKHIEECGRTCYQSADKITGTSASQFIKSLITRGHESVLEHGVATFKISNVSRACTHQIVRHRPASFSQQSQRYVEEDNFNYVTPPSISNNIKALEIYIQHMISTQEVYTKLRALNILKEDARFVLPSACESEIVITANMREWRHIAKERLAPSAQWEFRELMKYIIKELKQYAPNVFYDFEV